MSTNVEYVRLLRAASDALRVAQEYRTNIDKKLWRPGYADLITLETLSSQTEGEVDWWPRGNADAAMVAIVEAGKMIEAVPEGAWEFIDEDIQAQLLAVGLLARADDEVCGGCGERWPDGTGEVIECENEGCPGTCPKCQNDPCPHHEGATA